MKTLINNASHASAAEAPGWPWGEGVHERVASNDLFSRDTKRLYWGLIGAVGLVTWQEWQGLWHDFQLHAALVPEGRDAIRRIARFIRAFI